MEGRQEAEWDRTAALLAAQSAEPVKPSSLNPYRRKQKSRDSFGVDEIERLHRQLKRQGKEIT